jgi:hypothetical protein
MGGNRIPLDEMGFVMDRGEWGSKREVEMDFLNLSVFLLLGVQDTVCGDGEEEIQTQLGRDQPSDIRIGDTLG